MTQITFIIGMILVFCGIIYLGEVKHPRDIKIGGAAFAFGVAMMVVSAGIFI